MTELLDEMRQQLAAVTRELAEVRRERNSAVSVVEEMAATVHSLETQARLREAELRALEERRGEYLAKMQEQLATVTHQWNDALQVVAELQPEAMLQREAALLDRAEKAESELAEARAALDAFFGAPDRAERAVELVSQRNQARRERWEMREALAGLLEYAEGRGEAAGDLPQYDRRIIEARRVLGKGEA